MISAEDVAKAFDQATREFTDSLDFRLLIAGHAGGEIAREFLRNVFRTHYLSSHIIALCFAALPSNAAELLKENLLEEMGHLEAENPHAALLLEMARGLTFPQIEIDGLVADAKQRVAQFCATRLPVATLRELSSLYYSKP